MRVSFLVPALVVLVVSLAPRSHAIYANRVGGEAMLFTFNNQAGTVGTFFFFFFFFFFFLCDCLGYAFCEGRFPFWAVAVL